MRGRQSAVPRRAVRALAPALSFVVAGRPVPKARARRGAGGHWYTPARSAGYADRVAGEAWIARKNYERRVGMKGPWPTEGSYSVVIEAYLAGRYGMDTDNLAKQVLDACQGILWENDRQVRELIVRLERAEQRDQRLDVSVEVRAREKPKASGRHHLLASTGRRDPPAARIGR